MNKGLLYSLTEVERLLVAETEPDALAALDEDEVLELHVRVRRARTKYVKNYRRAASAAVADRGGRGRSYPENRRDRDKAEIFETALARVSRRVALLARAAAEELKQERLAAARAGASSAPPGKRPPAARSAGGPGRRPPAVKSAGGVKKDASTRAQGARRQAGRDARGAT